MLVAVRREADGTVEHAENAERGRKAFVLRIGAKGRERGANRCDRHGPRSTVHSPQSDFVFGPAFRCVRGQVSGSSVRRKAGSKVQGPKSAAMEPFLKVRAVR